MGWIVWFALQVTFTAICGIYGWVPNWLLVVFALCDLWLFVQVLKILSRG